MANQQTEVNQPKQNIDTNKNVEGSKDVETAIPERGVRSGTNVESPNVTGAGETSRNAARETGRPDTDMNSDTMGGDLSSDS